jgi:putative transposase
VIRFRFVEDHRGVYDVKRMCALVELPRSSFYAWAAGPTAAAQARDAADAELVVVIEQVWRDSRRTYGWPRVWGQLTQRRGMTVSRRRVARIMREHGFVGAHTRKRWRRGRPDLAPAADRLRRVFTAERPNLRWVADITEFPTGEGKLHLAAIRDLCHRGIVGWAMDEQQDAALVVDALTMALARTDPDGLIHHNDRGSQYTSLDFVMAAGHAGLQLSFGSTGDCFDNAAMETFWTTLKREIAHIRGPQGNWFDTRDAARGYLFEFIEVFYNRQRHQTGLGHLTPAEYAARFRDRP